MYTIHTINTLQELNEVFLSISETFYLLSKQIEEHYYPMGQRFEEMEQQFNVEKELLYYVKNDRGQIIAALTTKNYDRERKCITLAILCVKEGYRKSGIGSSLLNRFEVDCKQLGIQKITLGARFDACDFYLRHHYQPYLMVQCYDFMDIDQVLKANAYSFSVLETYQGKYYGFVSFDVKKTEWEYIEHFQKLPTGMTQFVFTKELT